MVEPKGSIKIDGLQATEIGLVDLRSNISVIPQVFVHYYYVQFYRIIKS